MSLRAKGSLWLAAVLVGALLLGASAGALAQQCAAPAARVVSIQGSLDLRPHNAKQWQAAQTGLQICSGDSVRVGPRSRAALLLPNETTLRLDQGTTLTLSAPDQAQASLLDLILGTIHVISRTPRPFRVNTPYLNAGVEGTEFLVASSETSARLAVFEGRVSATSADSSLMLVGGEIAYAAKGVPLRKERMLRPADAVQWALYYPTLFDHRLGEQIAGTPGEAALRESIALYRQDRLAEAIFRLDKAPEGLANPRFLTYRAGLLLLVGGADEAKAYIEGALALDAANSTAHALKSVVALTQNNKDQALKLANRAVELDQASPVARLALSYAQQAHFKIEEALASVQKAVDLDPQNALAWARLAELHMSTGYLDRALEAAKRAVSLNSEVAKTQSVLGFANLTRIDTQAAKQAFQKAIDLDQADPLPRLGLGLAMIREGELSAGREQLEIAVCLDPENSLLRSYVGKAYYEEKRDKLAGIQFDLAKERDPRDPTPWFYDAIRKQTENRPLEALGDLEKSIDLNDNRAVYRSQLLLDQDAAARSAGAAQIYDDLGFTQLAIKEATSSLIHDPRNSFAHRFLADAYGYLPRHEIARVSEVLQSQLSQPLNGRPVPPQLLDDSGKSGISRAGILRGLIPAPTAYNEYSRLFDRDRMAVIADAVVGARETLGHQLIVSGLLQNIAFSAGELHFDTNGSRRNSDLKRDVYDIFLQGNVGTSTSLQTEIRKSVSTRGATLDAIDPNFTSQRRLREAIENYRFGARHAFSPTADILVSAMLQDREFVNRTESGTVVTTESDTTILEGQTRVSASLIDLIVGGGDYRSRDRSVTRAPERGFPEAKFQSTHSNGYSYAQLTFPKWRTRIQLGLSADFFDQAVLQRKQVNPKLGLIWNLSPNTTVRLAAFQSVKRPVVANQTIEPTQVAGFNQFFDDINGTISRRAGFAVGHQLVRDLYTGLEITRRVLRVPLSRTDFTWTENSDRAYIYWAIDPAVTKPTLSGWTASLTANYEVEDFNRPEAFTGFERIVNLKGRYLPLGVRAFHDSGLSIQLASTYARQKGVFRVIPTSSRIDVDSRFWNTDLSVAYRLPKRLGQLTVGVKNLFDKAFQFQEVDSANPRFATEQFVYAQITLAF